MWNNLHGHLCCHDVYNSIIALAFAWFLPSDHEIHCIHNNLVQNIVFSNIARVLFYAFSVAHPDIKKFKAFLRASVYHKCSPRVSEFGYQDATVRFICLIPGNVCVQYDIVPCLSNDSLPILKKYKLVILKSKHLLLAKKTMKKHGGWILLIKPWNCQKFFKENKLWNRTLKQIWSFDITRADIRKILS